MDIGAISQSAGTSYLPGMAGAARGGRGAVAGPSGAQPGGTPATPATPTTPATTPASAKTQEAIPKNAVAAATPAAAAHIKFEVTDGTRVMDVYNSKNVLIYQLPPKGSLTLIHSAESAGSSQVKTSA